MDIRDETFSAPDPAPNQINLLAKQEQQLMDSLAEYEPSSATHAWFDTLRAIEEVINLVNVDWDDDFHEMLFSMPVFGIYGSLGRFAMVRQRLAERFGETFCERFTQLVMQGCHAGISFRLLGLADPIEGFQSVASMLGYFQSRRRHCVGLLHLLPTACRGQRKVTPHETLDIFLPLIERHAIPMVGLQNALNVTLARAKLDLSKNPFAELAMLDSLFLEPERSRLTEMSMTAEGLEMLKSREPLSSDHLFSAAELRNDILLIEAAYAEFNLSQTEFAGAAALVRRLSQDFVEGEFWVSIRPPELEALADALRIPPSLRSALVRTGAGYVACLSTYAPLILVDGTYKSTVTLLSRFIYYWRGRSLDRKKRFQIRAGFIFEQAVAHELTEQGFVVQQITRISRREFDVVTIRDGVIWNIQCKNNFIELAQVENNTTRFARYNSALVKSYERALTKERNREHLLQSRLALDAVQHIVVSRFPVVSDNPRLVPFSRIGTFAATADALLADTANEP